MRMKTLSSLFVLPMALAGGLAPAAPFAQITDSTVYFRYAKPFRTAIQLPATGPGAAMVNPARMAESGRGHVLLDKGTAGNVTTLAAHVDFALGDRLIYLGAGFLTLGESGSGTNAVYLDNSFQTQIAYRHSLDGEEAFWSVGYAGVYRHQNAYGVWKNSRLTHAIGMVVEPAPIRGLHANAGLVVHDLVPTEVTLEGWRAAPDSTYTLYQWSSDATLALASPARLVAAHVVLTAFSRNDSPYPKSGPLREGWGPDAFRMALNRYGIEVNATRWASVRAERLWNRYWAFGATLRLDPLISWKLETDFGVTSGPLLENMRSQRSGLHSHLGLRAGW